MGEEIAAKLTALMYNLELRQHLKENREFFYTSGSGSRNVVQRLFEILEM